MTLMLGWSPWHCLSKHNYENFMLAILVCDIHLISFLVNLLADGISQDLLAALAAPKLDKGWSPSSYLF